MADQLAVNDCGEIVSQPLTWDGEPVWSVETVREGLFRLEAFQQVPGQLAIEERRTADYYVQSNIGKARYVVNFHDGTKTHADGSRFYDVRILGNKRDLAAFITRLRESGYVERSESCDD